MFGEGDLGALVVQLGFGLRHQLVEMGLVFVGQQRHGLVPERRFQVDAQRAERTESVGVEGQRHHQAEPHRRRELVGQAADAAARAGFHQPQHARHLELFAQLADADADFMADFVKRREARPGLAALGEQVTQES